MIPYIKHNINKNDIKAVVKVLKSDNLTQGPEIELFENNLKKLTKSKHAIVVNSSTSALHLSCLALGLKKGDYLWTSTTSFVASSNCGLYCDAKIDFVDIDLNDYNIDIIQLKKKLKEAKKKNKLPKILVVVHLAGISCKMNEIKKLSKIYKFFVIEDACHAISGKFKNSMVGSCKYSDITTFSFHAIKNITSGEGGAVMTNNSDIARKLVLLRTHGITRDKKFFSKKNFRILPTHYEQVLLGYNFRLTDFQAALARNQLKRINKIFNERKKICDYYDKSLINLPIIKTKISKEVVSGYHLYIIRIDETKTKKKRFELVNYLLKKKISVGFHYIPIFLHYFYKKYNFKIDDFPNTKMFSNTAISLPLYNGLDKKKLKRITALISKFFNND